MKKIISFILTILITFLILILVLSYGIKEAALNTISSVIVSDEVASGVGETIKEVYPEISYETLDQIEDTIKNSSELEKITEKYFDSVVFAIENDTDVSFPETKEELLNIINENENLLKENGIYVSEEKKNEIVDKAISSGAIEKTYEKISNEINENMPEVQKVMVTTYNNIISNQVRIIAWVGIIISIILIAFVKKSFYKFSFNVAIALFISGVIAALLAPLVSNFIADGISEALGREIVININNVINYGYICFALCALFTIVYLVLDKMVLGERRRVDY